ncbi:MAG: D-glycero-beta-D-manno-heptose 1-phosphate adenylyltransferase [Nitrospirae bacterium]|nr:D-glycero-beta-D-manno-heptose 1-phosphate adenylyltransferase [Nitrospirota bacterium]MBI5696793.1 D-glycero-beta-D-manno-heptose 1-phosphate adenylyltransferase [Nitrospirota bacterium]
MKTKVKTQEELQEIIADLHTAGKKVAFTNGCFDIIHTGHVRYLKVARGYADVLIVAVNSDESVRRIKGEKRPIMSQAERAEVLGALSVVDYVTVFEEDDPHRVITELLPDVLVKGGDWDVDHIVGRDVVEENGGKVYSVPYIEGASTTGIVERILERYCGK